MSNLIVVVVVGAVGVVVVVVEWINLAVKRGCVQPPNASFNLYYLRVIPF